MPNRSTHENAGVVVGILAAAYYSQELPDHLRAAEIIGGAIGGLIGGLLPDRIEPSTSPNHRAAAHSCMVGVGVGVLFMNKLTAWQNDVRSGPLYESDDPILRALEEPLRHFLAGMIAGVASGYLSHLALDSLTPRSLPLVGLNGFIRAITLPQ